MSRTYGDRADGADKLRLMKKQVDSLKKANARLVKELNQALRQLAELQDAVANPDEPRETSKKKKSDSQVCTKCNEGVYVEFRVSLRGNAKDTVYLTCNNPECCHRKVQK